MKKLMIAFMAFLMLSAGAVLAQEKKEKILSGNLSFFYEGAQYVDGEKNGTSSITFEVGPSLLFQIKEKFYLGGEISANMYNYREYENGDKIETGYKNMFGAAPIVRCYAYKNSLIGIFTDTKAGFYFGRDKAKTNYIAVAADITPGIEIYFGERFSLGMSPNRLVYFDFERADPKEGDATNQTNFGFLFNPLEMNYAPLLLTVSLHL